MPRIKLLIFTKQAHFFCIIKFNTYLYPANRQVLCLFAYERKRNADNIPFVNKTFINVIL